MLSLLLFLFALIALTLPLLWLRRVLSEFEKEDVSLQQPVSWLGLYKEFYYLKQSQDLRKRKSVDEKYAQPKWEENLKGDWATHTRVVDSVPVDPDTSCSLAELLHHQHQQNEQEKQS